ERQRLHVPKRQDPRQVHTAYAVAMVDPVISVGKPCPSETAAGRPVGACSWLIMNVRPQLFGRPGKNSASLVRGAIAVFSMVTPVAPIALRDISWTVCG